MRYLILINFGIELTTNIFVETARAKSQVVMLNGSVLLPS